MVTAVASFKLTNGSIVKNVYLTEINNCSTRGWNKDNRGNGQNINDTICEMMGHCTNMGISVETILPVTKA